MDRIRESKRFFSKTDNAWWNRQEQIVYGEENRDTPTVVSVNQIRLNGWAEQLVSEQVTTDIHGKKTRSTEILDRYKRMRFRLTQYADSDTAAEQVFLDNRLVSSVNKTGVFTPVLLRSSRQKGGYC